MQNFNAEIHNQQQDLNNQISAEVAQFAIKLREELNRERENFQLKYEQDEQEALAEYNVSSIEAGGVLDILSDDQNKDALDELITQFTEKIESEIGAKDSAMTKDRNNEWERIKMGLQEAQHSRGRNIINEIIETSNKFQGDVSKYTCCSDYKVNLG